MDGLYFVYDTFILQFLKCLLKFWFRIKWSKHTLPYASHSIQLENLNRIHGVSKWGFWKGNSRRSELEIPLNWWWVCHSCLWQLLVWSYCTQNPEVGTRWRVPRESSGLVQGVVKAERGLFPFPLPCFSISFHLTSSMKVST